MFEVVKAEQKYIDDMKNNLRVSDEKESLALSGLSAKEVLQKAFDMSELCWSVLVDKNTIACFGVNRACLLSNTGNVWIIGTDKINKYKFRFARGTKKYIKIMFESFDRLQSVVSVNNKVSIAWIKWCGFHVEENKMFHSCWLEK